ncbi:Scr1 family TA system antitoxin-like transcriptional regulator [Actinokineospora sp. 24-640]
MPLAPSVARRLLRFELERLVAETRVTHATVASWLGVSRASVTLALAGKNLVSQPAIEVLCNRLDRAAWFPRSSSLLAAARRKTEPDVDAVSGQRDVELVVGLEAFAEQVTVFDPWLVPVHLQTQMYAAALAKLGSTVQNVAREQRQAPLLDDRDPLVFQWITSEYALRRRIGGTPAMDDQRSFLVELTGRANIELWVIPASVELPPVSPFQIVYGTPPVVVEPSRLAVCTAHDLATVAYFERLAEGLRRRALSPRASVALLREWQP